MSSPPVPFEHGEPTPLDVPLSRLMAAPVVVGSADPVRRVARSLSEAGASAAVLVTDGRAVGIVTDADLRARHLAAGRSDGPVAEVATPRIHSLGPDATVADALGLMASRRLHHIPIVDGGRPVGMVDAAAVLSVMAGDPLTVLATAATADDPAELARARARLPAVVRRLSASGSGGLVAVQLVSLFTEQALRRIVDWAVEELGPPPGPYAVVALGSLARREQTLVTDQDHALVTADGAADEPWFAAFGERVTDGLATMGIPRCPGGVMIANPEWRNDASGWRHRWASFLARPEPDHVLASHIVLDARTVAGDPALAEPFHEVARRATAGNTGSFLLFLAAGARELTPPLGFLGRWKLPRRGPHAGRFDIKAGAVLPIVALARIHGLVAGSRSCGTVDRLREAARAGLVSADTADILTNGYDLVISIRLAEQAARAADGRELDNWLAPAELPAWDRAGLREVCRTIRTAQDALSLSYLGAYV